MSEDRILAKAEKLGYTNLGKDNKEKIANLKEQLGIEDLDELESSLDGMLSEQTDNFEDLDDVEYLEEEILEENNTTESISEEVEEDEKTDAGENDNNESESEKSDTEEKTSSENDNSKKKNENNDFSKQKGQDNDDEKINSNKKENEDKSKQKRKDEKDNNIGNEKDLTNKNSHNKFKEMNNSSKPTKKREKFGRNSNHGLNKIEKKSNGLKKNISDVGKKFGQKIGDGAKKLAAEAGKKIVQFLGAALKNPYVWLVLGIVVLLTIIILMVTGGTDAQAAGFEVGYYDSACDFNQTTIAYNYTDLNEAVWVNIDDFVKGATYAYTNEKEFTNEQIKAIMIALKTNVLSIGAYNNIEKSISISDKDVSYLDIFNLSMDKKEKLDILYNEVKGMLYLPSSYSNTITELNISQKLDFDIENFVNIEGSYKVVLQTVYNNSDLALYDLADNCTFYSLGDNESYWWPIGSLSATSGNIYGGTPSTVYVSSKFGPRTIGGVEGMHSGIDIASTECEKNVIVATREGTVIETNDSCESIGSDDNTCGGKYGNYVKIDHGNGIETVYAHMWKGSVSVKTGDKVKQGQKIGLMGSSGRSTGCHLHFEIKINGTRVDPLGYVSSNNPRPVVEIKINTVDGSTSTPQETKVAVCKSLLSSGFSKNAVAGMMVNIQAEGSFKLNNLEGCYEENQCCTNSKGNKYGYCMHPEIKGFGSDDKYTAGVDSGAYSKDKFINDRAGYGLIQWTSSGRKSGLYDLAKSSQKSIANLGVQLEWLLTELKGYDVTYKYITGNYDTNTIAENFCLDFERPDNKAVVCKQRAQTHSETMLSFVNNGCS